jgi:hypothetical protein
MLQKAVMDFLQDNAGGVFLLSGVVGGLVGGLLAGFAAAVATYIFSRKLFKSKILDHARREIKEPLGAYMEWLTNVAGEFSLWKADLLPAFLSDSTRDIQELNRMRRLFVDQRNSLWLSKLEEYDTLLHKFNPVIRGMWFRQMEINECFNQVFRCLESDPPEALQAGEKIETLAFEQCQLTTDFLYQLQYECLRTVAARKRRMPRDQVKPRIVRTHFGRIKLMIPGKR